MNIFDIFRPSHLPDPYILIDNKFYIFGIGIFILLTLYATLSLIKNSDCKLKLPSIGICVLGIISGLYFSIISILIIGKHLHEFSKYSPGEFYLYSIITGLYLFFTNIKKYIDEIIGLFVQEK